MTLAVSLNYHYELNYKFYSMIYSVIYLFFD
uniref:Uncharacterized protein n=1 Tax=Arundo donax TaxID=35708 RepID=A0A0A8Z466_ARUDO